MALLSAICPNCGGAIQLDDTKKSGNCEYCGGKVVLQDTAQPTLELSEQLAAAGVSTKQALHKRAGQHINEGNLQEAEKIYQKILDAIDPEDADAWWGLYKVTHGNFILENSRIVQRAMQKLENENLNVETVFDNESNKEWQYAMQYATAGQKEKFLTEFKGFQKQGMCQIYCWRGNRHCDKGEYNLAISDYTSAVELDDKNAGLYKERGRAYLAIGETDSAIEDFSKAIALEPHEIGNYDLRGGAYLARGEYDKAIEDFSKQIELDPQAVGKYQKRGNVHFQKKDYNMAILDYTRAMELNPDDIENYRLRATAYSEKGEGGKAIEDCSQVIALNPSKGIGYRMRGMVFGRKGDYKLAAADFTKAIELEPNNPEGRLLRAQLHEWNKKYWKAISDYEAAIAWGYKNDAIYAQLARVKKIAAKKERRIIWIGIALVLLLVLGFYVNIQNDQMARRKEVAPLTEMVHVKGGAFMMGNTFNNRVEGVFPHYVKVNGFYIRKYSVSCAEYKLFPPSSSQFGTNYWQNDANKKRPVRFLKWIEAVQYCNWLSEQENLKPCYTIKGDTVTCDFSAKGYRLPTEAEWEYAARGGAESKGYMCSGGNTMKEITDGKGWYEKAEVTDNRPNELGLYGMSSGYPEWCWDFYGEDYYLSGITENPRGPSSGKMHVSRGQAVVFYRTDQDDRYPGFRLVRSE